MTVRETGMLTFILAILTTGPAHAQGTEIDALRAELDRLRADYESRIAALEQRLTIAEQKANTEARAAVEPAASVVSMPGVWNAGQSAFNPAIGVIFQGHAWQYGDDPDQYSITGFPFGGEAGPLPRGLALGETEVDWSANVDDKFTAWLTTPIVIEDGEAAIEIEEAWLETTALPAGFSARFGRFFSGIGYLNGKHSHAWDFADQPLPYQAFLGDQYLDDGVQLRWIAPLDVYLELGGEVLRGGRFPAAGADHAGFGSYSLFASLGGDIGADTSWLAGVSYLDVAAEDRLSGDEDDPFRFTGDSTLTGAHLVWKWAPNGNWKQKNFVFQTEMMWRNEDGRYTLPGGTSAVWDLGQRGWYAQAIYQPIPRWRFGGRIDTLSSDNPGAFFAGTALADPGRDPRRFSLMTDWSNSEFSRLRLQYTRDKAGPGSDNQWGLQYIYSIGAHGAHTF